MEDLLPFRVPVSVDRDGTSTFSVLEDIPIPDEDSSR
jgi:hypothetical protein